MRYEDLDALVMQVRSYRETSAMVQVFSRQAGRFSMVMRGARKPRRPQLVQPFVLARMSCFGKGSLLTNVKYEVTGQVLLQGNQLAAGLYVLEVLRRSTVEFQAEPQVYELVLDCLQQLQQLPSAETVQVSQCLRPFELNLLDCLGYGVDFSCDAHSGMPIEADADYCLVEETGFVKAGPGQSANWQTSGAVLLAIAANDFSHTATLQAAQKITHQLLPALIGHEPLVSRALWST